MKCIFPVFHRSLFLSFLLIAIVLLHVQCETDPPKGFSEDYNPTTSNDGKSIAFVSERLGYPALYVMDNNGRNQQKISPDSLSVSDPDMSPDGSKIVFTSRVHEIEQIFIITSNGQDLKQLTNKNISGFQPVFSPDGSKIAFVRREKGALSIVQMNSDGSNEEQLTSNQFNDYTPAWSPDGSKILFVSSRSGDGMGEIYEMNADGTNQMLFADHLEHLVGPVWSPDGKKVIVRLWSNTDSTWDLYLMNSDGSQMQNLTNSPLINENNPVWSGDSKRIYFDTDENFAHDIYLLDLNSKRKVNITRQSTLPGKWLKDVKYGEFDRNVMDLWLVDSKNPAPLVIYYHGGGFRAGDKSSVDKNLLYKLMSKGISVAAVNYRYSTTAPYPAQLKDCSRALQYIRYHSEEYNIDYENIAATGGSAGAVISMWLAFRDNMADPEDQDPVLRESTRIKAAIPIAGPAYMDPDRHFELFKTDQIQPPIFLLFGVKGIEDFKDPEILKLSRDASPLDHLTSDDPPVSLYYGANEPLPENPPFQLTVHHALNGIVIKEKCDSLGVECHLSLSDFSKTPINEFLSFLSEKFEMDTF